MALGRFWPDRWWPNAKNTTAPAAPVLRQPLLPAGQLSFICNICGHAASAPLEQVAEREAITCSCGSTLRFRSIIAALEDRLFGQISPLAQLPARREIRGLGMSETGVYCHLLQQKFDYVNTFLDRAPILDLMNPPAELMGTFDFVICSDVMEHVPVPAEQAFQNLRRLLRTGGVVVFTVPYTLGEGIVEHFPDLYQYELVGSGAELCLVNTTRGGEEQTFRDLHFHGGDGSTLEMRLFSLDGAVGSLERAGFRDLELHRASLPHWGVVNFEQISLPITALAG